MQPVKILFVDDEADLELLIRKKYEKRVQSHEWEFHFAANGVEALELLEVKGDIAVALLDINMPKMDGLTLLSHLRERYPYVRPIMLTGYGDMQNIRKAIHLKVYDFLTKPVDFTLMEAALDRAIQETVTLSQATTISHRILDWPSSKILGKTVKSWLKDTTRFGDLIGKSPAMQHVYTLILQAARSDRPLLITGKSGTGKELVANTIHQLSDRGQQPFMPVNCGAIPENLFESEMFGYVKGAFTGALTDKAGALDGAHRGTLLLDEVAELSLDQQAKLLRALQSGEYKPVGSNVLSHVDVRIIAATNQNLQEMVKAGSFREDLFYRLHVFDIQVPPLRDRHEDLPLLIEFFLEQLTGSEARTSLPPTVLAQLQAHSWPGNVRELQNVLYRYLNTQQVTFADTCDKEPTQSASTPKVQGYSLDEILDHAEQQAITQALEQHNWHRGNTAKVLGLTVRSLHRKISKYQILQPYARKPSEEG